MNFLFLGPQGSGKGICAELIQETLSKIRLPYHQDTYHTKVKIFDGIKIPRKIKCDIAIIIKQE